MAVSYEKLFKMLEEKGLTKYYLRENGITHNVVNSLAKNKSVNVSSIMALCKLFNCQPSDVMEYVPDEEDDDEYGI
ncbi:MAG: helix-turn-helix transcriptional regulator [Ruminococcus sp.]|nr:helix-turn-helix transcriptional regulator [Ruminococcus sp.]